MLVGVGGNWGGSRPIRAKMSARSAMGGGTYPNCVIRLIPSAFNPYEIHGPVSMRDLSSTFMKRRRENGVYVPVSIFVMLG